MAKVDLDKIFDFEKILKTPALKKESLEIIQAIELATHRAIEDEGELGSTNKIANIAGVSIGSLYRYFLSKESILKYVILKQLKENRKKFISIITVYPHLRVDEIVLRFIGEAADVFFERKKLYKILFQQVDSLELRKFIYDNRLSLARELAPIVKTRVSTQLDIRELEDRIFIATNIFTNMLEYNLNQDINIDPKIFKDFVQKMVLLAFKNI